MKLSIKVLAAAAMLGLAATSAQASTLVQVAGVTGDVGSFDWATGNGLAVGAVPLTGGGAFTLNYQARLNAFQDGGGVAISANSGLNTNYEVTLVGAVREISTALSPTAAQFSLASTTPSASNIFQMFVDTARNSSDLAGTGFNDGRLVLTAHVVDAFGNFSVNTVSPTGPLTLLDQFNGDSWGGTQTVRGVGGTQMVVQVDSYDPTYFLLPPTHFLIQMNVDTQNNLPFSQTDPGLQVNGVASNVGPINGISGPNMLLEVDASSSPIVTPEPSTMVLLGAGLFGLSVFSRRRKQS